MLIDDIIFLKVEIYGDEDSEQPPKSDEEKQEDKEKEDNKKKELMDIDVKSGDYQIIVHIIEARDLKAENLDGTSDPVVYLTVLEQKQNSKVIHGVTNCVFDDLFIFNFKDLDKETFNEGFVRIAVYDSSIIKKTMIGAFVIDIAQVYAMNKYHEFYRQWVPLMDDEDASDVGVQGYLKVSVQVIGPGDKVRIHDEDAELAEEIAKESKAGNDVSSLIMNVPTIRKEWQFLVVSIFR